MDAPSDAAAAAFEYAEADAAMDYLYDFFDVDLTDRVRADRALVPEGMEDLLAAHSLEDYVWLWLKDTGPNSFWQFLLDGAADEDYQIEDARWALGMRLKEWAMDSPPHIAWFKEDGSELPVID